MASSRAVASHPAVKGGERQQRRRSCEDVHDVYSPGYQYTLHGLRVRDMEVTHWRVFFFYAILLSVSIRSE
jgi:hypothetical protein